MAPNETLEEWIKFSEKHDERWATFLREKDERHLKSIVKICIGGGFIALAMYAFGFLLGWQI